LYYEKKVYTVTVNNSTIIKTNNYTCHFKSLYTHKPTYYANGNQGSGLEHAQRWGWVKSVNGIPTLFDVIIGSLKAIQIPTNNKIVTYIGPLTLTYTITKICMYYITFCLKLKLSLKSRKSQM